MRIKFLKSLCLTTLISLSPSAYTQAQYIPLIEQYLFNTQVFNPATVAMNDQSEVFILAEYQYFQKRFTNPSYLTYLISLNSAIQNNRMGIGLNILNHRFSREKILQITADYSYKCKINAHSNLCFGINAGLCNFRNPLTQYKLIDDAYDPAFSKDINEIFSPVGVGVYYYSMNYFIGLSSPQILIIGSDHYSLKSIYLHSGLNFPLSQRIELEPATFFQYTINNSYILDLSLSLKYNKKIFLGAILHSGHEIILVGKWMFFKKFGIGYSSNLISNKNLILKLYSHSISACYDL